MATGSMVLSTETRRMYLVGAAIPVHFALSAFWGVVLALLLSGKRPVAAGTLSGLTIGAVDLLVIGRRFPRIRALPALPQFADHIAFGVTVAGVLKRSRR
jgi:hypothetical protein